MKRLCDLPGSSIVVPPDTRGRAVDEAFKSNPKLAGVVVVDRAGSLQGIISRSAFLGLMSRRIGNEIFANRPVTAMLKHVASEAMELPAQTEVPQAVEQGLSRKNGHAYEPLLIKRASGEYALINFHELILAQADVLEETMQVVEEKNRMVESSIQYAERIQQSMLYSERTKLPTALEYFVLFRPRDIVSGDFYWMAQAQGRLYLTVADCTGHGVPGAFMSLIGHGHLNTLVHSEKLTDPARILEELHLRVRRSLHQEAETDAIAYDGMELGLCVLDLTGREMAYAGAKRPLMLTRPDGELIVQKGDRQPIGGKQREERRVFTTHTFPLEPMVNYYLSSDGYADQSNPQNKKFGGKRLKETLRHIAPLELAEQEAFLNRTLDLYQQDEPQRDDIALMGFRLTALNA